MCLRGWAGQPMAYLTCFASTRCSIAARRARDRGRAGEGQIWLKKGPGPFRSFPQTDELKGKRGPLALGHVRYDHSREGRSPENTQPLLLRYRHGELALAHNGRLVNGAALRDELAREGAIFQTGTDSELLGHLIARQDNPSLMEAVAAVAPRLKGAFAFLLSDGEKLIGLRDGYGFRPLSLGRLGRQGYFLASETLRFRHYRAKFIRGAGEGWCSMKGVASFQVVPAEQSSLCVFEYIYFARPDSNLQGKTCTWSAVSWAASGP